MVIHKTKLIECSIYNLYYHNEYYYVFVADKCKGVVCEADEICVKGKCMTAPIKPCPDKKPTNDGNCKCGDSKICNALTAPFCEISLNNKTVGCKCSADVEACTNDSVDRCLNGKCSCGTRGYPCAKENEFCALGFCSKEFFQKSASLNFIAI